MDAAAAAAAVVHEGYLTCIVVSSLVGRPFIKANRRCVCSSSSIRILFFYSNSATFPTSTSSTSASTSTPIFSPILGGYFSFFSAIPIIVLFSPSPLMMIIIQSSSSHTNYPSIFGFSFYFSFYFSFLFCFLFLFLCHVVVPDDVFHQDLSREASKQTAI